MFSRWNYEVACEMAEDRGTKQYIILFNKVNIFKKKYLHLSFGAIVMMLTKERHREHKKVERKMYIYSNNRNKIWMNLVKQ